MVTEPLAVDDCHRRRRPSIFFVPGIGILRGNLVMLERMVRQWGIPLALYSSTEMGCFKYNARQAPVLAESTQFDQPRKTLVGHQYKPTPFAPSTRDCV